MRKEFNRLLKNTSLMPESLINSCPCTWLLLLSIILSRPKSDHLVKVMLKFTLNNLAKIPVCSINFLATFVIMRLEKRLSPNGSVHLGFSLKRLFLNCIKNTAVLDHDCRWIKSLGAFYAYIISRGNQHHIDSNQLLLKNRLLSNIYARTPQAYESHRSPRYFGYKSIHSNDEFGVML